MLSSCATGQVNYDWLYILFPIGVTGSLPDCITGHSEYKVSQLDVQLCNQLFSCIMGVR